MKRLTTEQFIDKAKLFHPEYDYSKVNYVNYKTKVEIICPIHGSFFITPSSSLRGCGCQKCSNNFKFSTEEYISKAKKIHPEYDYSKTFYDGSAKKITVICSKHGEFKAWPIDFLKGMRCPCCRNEERKSTTEEFIAKAKKVHGNRYDYSKVNYINVKTKVEIICPVHGSFWQRPDGHLSGFGCAKCISSRGENIIRKTLQEENLTFEEQKRFPECCFKYPLIFDFWIPSLNLAIEFNGRQHYEAIDFFGGQERLKEQQTHDALKESFCQETNKQLLVISYKEDVEKICRKRIQELKKIIL